MRKHHVGVQEAIERFNGTNGLWLAGMYTRGSDFHESAVRFAMRSSHNFVPLFPSAELFPTLANSRRKLSSTAMTYLIRRLWIVR